MEKHPAAAGLGNVCLRNRPYGAPGQGSTFPFISGTIRCSTLFRCSLFDSSVMVRRSFLVEQNLRYDESFSFSHDFELWSRAVFAGDFHLLPRYLTYYRRSPGTYSGTFRSANEHASRVYSSLLKKMGYRPAAEELSAHPEVYRNGYPGEREQEHYRDILSWCESLYKTNEKSLMVRPYLVMRSCCVF